MGSSEIDTDIEKIRKEIEQLKKNQELKEQTFELIKNGQNDEARKILEKNNEILSYFIKFEMEPDKNGKVILTGITGWEICYNSYYENEIIEDLQKCRKEIEEKEIRLEQKIYLLQQQDFLKLQKKDLEENKLNREKTEKFTFVLAFGVIITLLYYTYSLIYYFINATTLHLFLITGIFILIFIVFIQFISDLWDMDQEIKRFFKNNKVSIILISVAVLLIILCLYLLPNVNIKNDNLQDITNNLKIISEKLTEQNNILNKSNLFYEVNNMTILDNIQQHDANQSLNQSILVEEIY